MNQQLKKILFFLNQNKLEYWIDSGTLLGIMREGDVLKNDKDIDIGIHYNHLERFIPMLDEIVKMGYKMRYEKYNGIPCKYKLYHRKENTLRVDINIYRQKNKDYLWSPISCFKIPNGIFSKQIQKIIKFFWRRVFKSVETNKFPYNKIKNTYTWIIPYEYYNNIKYYKQKDCYIFNDFKSYLTYRYGDWKTENKNWNLFRDDGGITKKNLIFYENN